MKDKKFILFVSLGFSIVFVGTIGYMLIEGWSFLNSLYMTIITITSVGYGEIAPLSVSGKIFTIVLIVIGLSIILYIIGFLVEETIEGRIRKILGKRRFEKVMTKLNKHTIIAGFGRSGEILASELLKRKIKFVVIENNSDRFSLSETLGYITLNGDATDEIVLKSAGIQRASYFVSLLPTDADNIYSCISARELNPNIYTITRAINPKSRKKLLKIGVNKVVSLHHLGARKMANAIAKPNVIEFFDIITTTGVFPLSVEEIKINQDSVYSGKKIKDSGLREKFGIIIIGIITVGTEKMFYNPSPDYEIKAGDVLIVIGEREKLFKLIKSKDVEGDFEARFVI